MKLSRLLLPPVIFLALAGCNNANINHQEAGVQLSNNGHWEEAPNTRLAIRIKMATIWMAAEATSCTFLRTSPHKISGPCASMILKRDPSFRRINPIRVKTTGEMFLISIPMDPLICISDLKHRQAKTTIGLKLSRGQSLVCPPPTVWAA